MCVILAAIKQQRPSEQMVREAWKKNDDGGGIAYREKDPDGTPVLVWKKDLNLEQMLELCGTVELPYIAHFRIASSGGIRPELCHPFPISHTAPRVLEGRSKDEYVLFHNGDWREWQDYVLKAAVDPRAPELPPGKWNDTRGMAWLCSIYGIHFMDLIEHKGVAFSATDYEIFLGKDGWKEINGVWCSNDYFWSGPTKLTPGPGSYQSQMCRDRKCTIQYGLEEGYCFNHRELRPSFRKPQNSETKTEEVAPKPEPVKDGAANPPLEARVTDGDKSKKDYSKSHGDGKKKEVICIECRALLSLKQSHTAECNKGPKPMVPGMVCSDCHVPAGRQHLTTCKVVNAGFQCFECKQQIRIPKDHYMSCSHFDKPIPLPLVTGNAVLGNAGSVNSPVPGGGQVPNDPFHVILTAARACKEGKMSLQELKIVKKRLGFQHLPTKDINQLEKWAIEQRKVVMQGRLKDPRMEVVTTIVH